MVTLCSGIALLPRDGDNLELIIQRADAAMYRVQQRGRNGSGCSAVGSIELAAAHGQPPPR